jgi:hypothetical protein
MHESTRGKAPRPSVRRYVENCKKPTRGMKTINLNPEDLDNDSKKTVRIHRR